MPFQIFTIPIRDPAESAVLNAFLQSHRVLAVERRWVEQGTDSFWCFCVEYLDGGTGRPDGSSRKPRKDYKDLLSPEDFAIFARLRELRKEIATVETVPVYTIFTNDHLAQMVTNRARTKSELAKIEGLGEARIDKYGDRFLEILVDVQDKFDEKSGATVSTDS